jgi:hypothetical protein
MRLESSNAAFLYAAAFARSAARASAGSGAAEAGGGGASSGPARARSAEERRRRRRREARFDVPAGAVVADARPARGRERSARGAGETARASGASGARDDIARGDVAGCGARPGVRAEAIDERPET